MRKSRNLLLLLLLSSFLSISAQNDDFKAFRDRMLSDYSQFRRQVLSDYDKFLAGVWKEYETFRSDKPGKKPKPTVLPTCPDLPHEAPVELTPSPESNPVQLPVSQLVPGQGKVPSVTPPTFTPPTISPLDEAPVSQRNISFTYCGLDQRLPEIAVPELSALTPEKISEAWKALAQSTTEPLLSYIKAKTVSYGLNDWLTFTFVQAYVEALASNRSRSERVLMTQFLMSHLGYDVRLAKTDRQLTLLMPFKEKVYARMYINQGNQNYFVFFDGLSPIDEGNDCNIYTCSIPDDATLGNNLSLVVPSPIKIDSGESHPFAISYEGINVQGAVDKNVMELFRHYPQTEISVYASSVISADIRNKLLSQLSSRLNGLSELDKVNQLLHFTQSGFKYATDQDQHGYEKFYFLEENLYYPKNDCEDRAIFFGYLVKNLVGIDVQLIEYPEHESCAVGFTVPVSGDFYLYKGKKYVISDPCYIGADVGQCMTRYKQTAPKIEFTY